MEFLFFLIFFGIIIFNAFKGKGSKKPVKAKHFRSPKSYGNTQGTYDALPDAASRVNAAQRASRTGAATAAKYKRLREQRRKAQDRANTGLWGSKHRQDKNRHRRTDWGAEGDAGLLSPKMIGIIVGGLLTFYLVLTVVMTG